MAKFPRRATAILAGAALVAGLAACAPQSQPESESTLQINMYSYMITGNWNPITTTYLNTYFTPQQAVYETLIRLNGATAEYEPLLAEEFTIGDDQTSMQIKLREDVDFTDGTHLDAEVVKASLDLATTDTVATPLFERYAVEIEVTGEYELELTTSITMGSEFMFNLAILPVVSPTAMEEDPAGLETHPVGTGPYLLEEHVPEASATFVRNPDYRDPDAYDFDRLEFLVFEDGIAASNALKSGQINVANLDPSLAQDAESDGFTIHVGGGTVYNLTWTDVDGSVQPALADVRVRQAIAYAIDREAINDTLSFGFGTVTSQVWGEGSPFYVEGGDDRYDFDVEKARDLMAEAGYADGFDVTIPTTPSFADYQPVLEQALADIGVRVTFEDKVDIAGWVEANLSGDYALKIQANADLFVASGLRSPESVDYPQLAEQFEILDTGTPEEAAAASQRIGEIVLDEALMMEFAKPLETWATIPEIDVQVGIITGWPPLLSGYTLVG